MIKILAVEDEKAVLENIVELLQAEGYDVQSAHDGEEAYRKIITDQPDLIICDVLMPRLDGLGLLGRLRQSAATAQIPIIFLTALTERNNLRAAMELGADDYITKPFARNEILGAIQERLAKRDALVYQTKREVVTEKTELSWSMPFECQQSISKILELSNTILHQSRTEPDVTRLVGNIHSEARHLEHSIRNYLALLQLEKGNAAEAGQASTNSPGSKLNEVVLEMAQATAWQYGRTNDLAINLEEARSQISESAIQRIVEELLINAFARTVAGDRVQVTGRISDAGRMYVVQVEDHGRPFSQELLAISSDPVLDARVNILTIGISFVLVWKLVEQYRGKFTVQTRPDGCNILEVSLPF